MLKDVYLFTNGVVMAFDGNGAQRPELQGPFTEDLKDDLLREITEKTRITFARWQASFFELTKEELAAAKVENAELVLRFTLANEKVGDL